MINNVVITGRLGKEIEPKSTTNGITKVDFSIANATGYGKQEKTNWINCVAWRQSADYLAMYAHKGDMVSVVGELTTRSYEKQDGTKAFITEVNCNRVEIISSSKSQQEPKGNTTIKFKEIDGNSEFAEQQTLSGDGKGVDGFHQEYTNIKADDLPFY